MVEFQWKIYIVVFLLSQRVFRTSSMYFHNYSYSNYSSFRRIEWYALCFCHFWVQHNSVFFVLFLLLLFIVNEWFHLHFYYKLDREKNVIHFESFMNGIRIRWIIVIHLHSCTIWMCLTMYAKCVHALEFVWTNGIQGRIPFKPITIGIKYRMIFQCNTEHDFDPWHDRMEKL